jgi:hypothetical protein
MLSLKFYRNVGIIVWLVSISTLAAFQFKLIDVTYLLIINMSAAIIEGILVVLILRKLLKNKIDNELSPKIIISKGKINNKYVKCNDNVFDKHMVPTNPMKDGIFRVCIELAEKFIGPTLELSIIRMCEAHTCEQKIDASHCSKGFHILHINVDPREKVNFRFNKDVKIKSIIVDEEYMP